MTEVYSVTVKLPTESDEYVALVEARDDSHALQAVLDESNGQYSKEHCTVLLLNLEPGAQLPIGFFWKQVVWLDDWGPTQNPFESQPSNHQAP